MDPEQEVKVVMMEQASPDAAVTVEVADQKVMVG